MGKVHTISTRAQFAPDLPLPDLVRIFVVLCDRAYHSFLPRADKHLEGHSDVLNGDRDGESSVELAKPQQTA